MASQAYNHPGTLFSIDALRGFDMLLIAGGGAFIELLEGKTGWKWLDMIAGQLHHAEWVSFTFYDFVFSLFLFISGLSLPFSINKSDGMRAMKKDIYRKAAGECLYLLFWDRKKIVIKI